MDIRNYTVPDYQGRDTKEVVMPQIQEILNNIRSKGIVYYNRRECVTGYAIKELYDWDLYFETLFLSYFGVAKFCRNNVEVFLDERTNNTVKYIIDKELRWRVRDMLDQMNINERMIYPGLDGLSQWLKRHYYVKE